MTEETHGHRQSDQTPSGGAAENGTGADARASFAELASAVYDSLAIDASDPGACLVNLQDIYNQQLAQYMSGGLGGLGSVGAYQASNWAGTLASTAYVGSSMLFNVYAQEVAPKIEDCGISVGEIMAWRAWRIEGDFLYSVHEGSPWFYDAPMSKNDGASNYGVHAWKTRNAAHKYAKDSTGVTVCGSVMLWGEVTEYERGYIAEFARVASLDNIFGNVFWRGRLLRRLRTLYGLTP